MDETVISKAIIVTYLSKTEAVEKECDVGGIKEATDVVIVDEPVPKKSIRLASNVLSYEFKRKLFEIVQQEIIDHMAGKSSIMSTSRSLCNSIYKYEIKNCREFVCQLLDRFHLDPDLRDYRSKIMRTTRRYR